MTLVDTGMRGGAPDILAALGQLGRQPQELTHILLTHYHLDHTGSLAELRRKTGARVGAHRADAPFVEGRRPHPSPFRPWPLRLLTAPLFAFIRVSPCPVDLPLEDGQEVAGLRVIHTPGHTPGSVCFYSQRHSLLLAGDALNRRVEGLAPPLGMVSLDMAQARASVKKLAGLEFETLCLGHRRPFLTGGAQRVRELAQSLP